VAFAVEEIRRFCEERSEDAGIACLATVEAPWWLGEEKDDSPDPNRSHEPVISSDQVLVVSAAWVGDRRRALRAE
jgi:hypothetical protein